MESKEKIYALLCKFDTLTADDKKAIKSMCAEAGIKAKFNTGCAQCYTDALLQLKAHYGVVSPVWADIPHVTKSGRYVMNVKPEDWHWVGHGMIHLSLDTPDEVIEQVIALHPQKYTRIKEDKK